MGRHLTPPLPAGCALLETPGVFRVHRDRRFGFQCLVCRAELRGLKTPYQAIEAFKAHECGASRADQAGESL